MDLKYRPITLPTEVITIIPFITGMNIDVVPQNLAPLSFTVQFSSVSRDRYKFNRSYYYITNNKADILNSKFIMKLTFPVELVVEGIF